MTHILVWDLETIPDLKGFAAANDHDGKTEDEIREAKPETILRWHRPSFKALWRWKTRSRPGRPKVES